MGQKMQVPGIIGGAGPGASSQLYLDIIARCRQAGVDRRPAVLMASLEIDLAMEAHLLETGEGLDGYLPAMAAAAQSLSRAGADFIVIPCNTLHLLLPSLQSALDLPVLSIVDGVVAAVETAGGRRVGLLGTGATVYTGLYQNGLEARGIEVICPDGQLLEALARMISAEVDQEYIGTDQQQGVEIVNWFEGRGAELLVAACTELKSLMTGWPATLPVVDSLDSLGAAVVREMLEPEISK